MSELALGVDIGGTKILVALVDAEGTLLGQWRALTPAREGGKAVMASVVSVLEVALASLGSGERERLKGIGVSAAGQVDFCAGAIAYASPNIPGWTGMPIRRILEDRFGLPVGVDNDANAAAFGEWWVGAGRGCPSLIMVTVGTGIGGGIVKGGRVLRGESFRGGEIGHMVLNAEGALCNCGQTGCLEVYASGTAIARLANEARPGWLEGAPAVFEAAEAGDELARSVLARSARYLAQGLVSLASVVDPALFLLGGGVSTQPGYLSWVRRALEDPSVSGARGFELERLKLARLGEAAGAVGAAGEILFDPDAGALIETSIGAKTCE